MASQLKQTTKSLIWDKFKYPTEEFSDLESGEGKIIEFDDAKVRCV